MCFASNNNNKFNNKNMHLTPGLYPVEKSLEPHIARPGK